MEQRKITVVSTRDQIRKTFMSSAKTLGELKREMTANGVDHEGLTYLEGLTKAEYIDDSSVLPLTVSYEDPSTGEEKITNELVFILSQPNKKIKSGSISRAEIYERIKNLNLKDKVKAMFGKDYTRVSTSNLLNVINESNMLPEPEISPCVSKPSSVMPTTAKTIKDLQTQIDNLNNNIDIIKKTIECACARSGGIDEDDFEAVMRILNTISPVVSVLQSPASKATDEHCAGSNLPESSLPKGILDNIIKGLN